MRFASGLRRNSGDAEAPQVEGFEMRPASGRRSFTEAGFNPMVISLTYEHVLKKTGYLEEYIGEYTTQL